MIDGDLNENDDTSDEEMEQVQCLKKIGNETDVGHAYILTNQKKCKAWIGIERFNDEDDTKGISNGEAVFRSSDALAVNIKKIPQRGNWRM